MQHLSLPYAHLNLRRNPFGHVDTAERAELAVVEIEGVVARLASPRYAVQFMGECGYGKTTHLLAIRACFAGAAYVHFPEGEYPPIPEGTPLLIDECQRVPRRTRQRSFRRCVPLVLGTHVDFAAELRAAGYDVETVDVARQTTPRRLGELFQRRIEHVRRGPGPVPAVSLSTATWLLDRFGPNVRAIEAHLYEVFHNLEEVGDV
jgi:hypothetical protein